MRQFNLCVISPPGYIHSQAFQELVEVIYHSLIDLDHATTARLNEISDNATNIIIGRHLLNFENIKSTPKNSIIINTKQITNDSTDWNASIYKWCHEFETWDYSLKNIEKLKTLGILNVKHLQIGHHPKLEKIPEPADLPIDVLFYGSIGERRQAVLDKLAKSGLNVKSVFGVYGKERDALISNAKVILNCHHFDSKIFEIVRAFYLMSNGKAVVAEIDTGTHIDAIYTNGVFHSSYDHLVDACIELIKNEELRTQTEKKAFATISKLPQTAFLKNII